MAKARKKLDYKPYPAYDSVRVGIKVSWYTYADKEKAEEASKVARHNAVIQESLGYDFGYQSPGAITKRDDGRFEVVIP